MASIRSFRSSDIPAARTLWEATPGVGLSAADALECLTAYLARNPRSSFVAVEGTELVGTILCGHDGRRGMIHHLMVAPKARRQGLARLLLAAGLTALREEGIHKCHLMIFRTNEEGLKFWQSVGAEDRVTLALYSIETGAAG
jgi:N-acetylglutamate synthase